MAKFVDGLIVDPFAGSGTIGIAAIDLGLPYIINDISPEDQEMFNLRRDQNKTQCETLFCRDIYVDQKDRLPGRP